MAGAWFHANSVLSLCDFAMENANKIRAEKFKRLVREDYYDGLGFLYKLGKPPTDEELAERYSWVFRDDVSDLATSCLILRSWIHSHYWVVEEKVKYLRNLAMTKKLVTELFETLDKDRKQSLHDFWLEAPGTGVWLSDKDFKALDIPTPNQALFSNDTPTP